MPSPATFISYSRTDSAFALKLAEDLKAAGAHVWLDQLDIHPGEEWDNAIETALTLAPSVLLILSPHSAKSSNVRNEISFALDEKKIILPVLHQDCVVPLQLRRIQHVDLRHDYTTGLKILLRQLSVQAPTAPAGAVPVQDVSSPEFAAAAEPDASTPPDPLSNPPKSSPTQPIPAAVSVDPGPPQLVPPQPRSNSVFKVAGAALALLVFAFVAYLSWPRHQTTIVKGDPIITYHIWVAAGGSFISSLNDTDWNVSKTSNIPYVNEVRFLNAKLGWAVGGTNIVRTNDGGIFWDVQTTPTNSRLWSIVFATPKAGWAVGDNGVILHSDNGGSTWVPQQSGTTVSLFEVAFADERDGWAVGANGTILHTADAGRTWTPQPSGVTARLFHVFFISAETGWAGGYNGTMLHTTNGGRSWERQPLGDNLDINCIFFASFQVGWFVGEKGVIRHTDDGGATWTPQRSPTSNFLNSVAFRNKLEGWAAGANGTLLRTTDGGNTWTTLNSGTMLNLKSIALPQLDIRDEKR